MLLGMVLATRLEDCTGRWKAGNCVDCAQEHTVSPSTFLFCIFTFCMTSDRERGDDEVDQEKNGVMT